MRQLSILRASAAFTTRSNSSLLRMSFLVAGFIGDAERAAAALSAALEVLFNRTLATVFSLSVLFER